MSWFSRFLFGGPASSANVVAVSALTPLSPWSLGSNLAPLVYSDIYGPTGSDAVTRDTAMTVGPIKRGRGHIVGMLSDLPLTQGTYDTQGEFVPDPTQPEWLTVTRTLQTPQHRIALTLDDLLFTGWSLWAIERDGDAIIDAARLARDAWAFDTASPTGVSVKQQHVTDPHSVLLLGGFDEGLLVTARDAIRGWRKMEAAWVGRVENPIPAMVLQETEENGVTPEEAASYVKAWSDGRRSPNGAVGFLPAGLSLAVHGEVQADLFVQGRNAARIDLANHLHLPVALLDGSPATASLTYATQDGSHSQLVDDLEYWATPIDARLSQADVCAPGTVIRLDRSSLTATPNEPTGPDRNPRTSAPALAEEPTV